MKFLVDANVVSEAMKTVPDSEVITWLKSNEEEILIDPVILGEIRFGILTLPV